MATTVEIVLRFVGSGAVAIGVLTAYGTVRMRLKVGQSHKWPTVPGKIVSSELESETERHNRKPITTYAAAIRYAYEVDGKAYESDQIQLGGTSETSQPGEFERMVKRYPEGKRVTVYYDPDDPATATLEPGELGGIFNMAMVAGGFILVGGIIVALTIWGHLLKPT
jgi:hypothetical protein